MTALLNKPQPNFMDQNPSEEAVSVLSPEISCLLMIIWLFHHVRLTGRGQHFRETLSPYESFITTFTKITINK
jgi:hypothetical protein